MNRMLCLTVAAILLAAPAVAQTVSAGGGGLAVVQDDPFAAGRWRGNFVAGWGNSLGDDYVLVGAGASYLVARGLDIGLDGETWLGHELGVSKLTPGIRYTHNLSPKTMPYVGGFYRRTFIGDDLPDYSSLGGRAGLYQRAGTNSVIGAGVVVEQYLDCDGDCTDVYPEASVSLFF